MRPLAGVGRNRRPNLADPLDEPARTAPPEPTAREPAAAGDAILRRTVVLAVALTLLPLFVAVARALGADRVLVGDSAAIAVRSADVIGGDPPLLGLWAYSSHLHGFDYNHPGPLLFDVLALPTFLLGHDAGAVVGNLAVHTAAIVATIVVAHRRGGAVVAAVAAVAVAALCWALGSAALVEPWHANSIVLPFLLFMLLVWSVTRGDVACLPWSALAGSLVLQTSLSYTLLVPGLAVWAVVGLWLHLRRLADDGTGGRDALRRRAARRGLTAVAVLAVCWAQPLWEQVTGAGPGNLTLLARGGGRSLSRSGPLDTVLGVLEVAAVPPRVSRVRVDSLYRSLTADAASRLILLAVVLVALGAVAAWCVRSVRRRHDDDSASLLMTAAVGLVLGLATATRAPSLELADYQVRWVWPLAAFLVFAAATVVVRGVADGRATDARLVGAIVATAVVVSVLNLMPSTHGTSAPARSYAVAAELVDQMDDVDVAGPVLVRCSPPDTPYCQSTMSMLDERGIRFLLVENAGVRTFGRSHAATDHSARSELTVLNGPLAELTPPGSRRIALNVGLGDDERFELYVAAAELVEHLGEPGDHLTDAGRRALRRGEFPKVREALVDGDLDGDVALGFGPAFPEGVPQEVSTMIEHEFLRGPGRWQERMDRYAELNQRNELETVGVFLREV